MASPTAGPAAIRALSVQTDAPAALRIASQFGLIGAMAFLIQGAVSGYGALAALPLLATVSSVPALIATLFMFGAGLGTVDSTVNLQAVIVERASGKHMMSGFHGLFSLGGIVGAAGVSALLGLGLTPLAAMLVVVAVLAGALF